MISQKTIEDVFDAAIIEDVISEFLVLKKSGANYKGLSPFSNEKTPSFMVSPSKQIWKDFSSGKGGNVVSFLMEHEKYSYPEAIKYLAKKYNIEIQETRSDDNVDTNKELKESTMLLIEFASKFFVNNLQNSDEGKKEILPYLKKRGINVEMIKQFEIGLAPKSKKGLSNVVLQKGFQKEIIKKSGLFLERENSELIDRFSGRLMFPIYNLIGRKVGFGGRILKNVKNFAKYINSPETNIYQKSKILYGLNFAKKEIIKKNECYLVEGYTDVITLHQKGIKNVVSFSGTAITINQVRLIKRFCENVSFLFDSDTAGKTATYKGIDLCLSEGLYINVISLPDGEDPDSFAKNKNQEQLEGFFTDSKQDFISFKCELELKNNTPKNKINLADSILNSILYVPNITTQAIYIQLASKKLNIKDGILFKELELKKSNKKTRKIKNQIDLQEENELKSSIEEKTLLRLLLNYGNKKLFLANKYIYTGELIINELNLDGISFSFPLFRKIVHEYQIFVQKNQLPDVSYFVQHRDSKIAKITSELILDKYKIDSWDKKNIRVKKEEDILTQLVEEALIRFKLKRIEEMKSSILKNIPNLNDNGKKLELIKFNKLNLLYQDLYNKIGREC